MKRKKINENYICPISFTSFQNSKNAVLISKNRFTFVSPKKKKKELDFSNSLIFRALQDGLEPTTP